MADTTRVLTRLYDMWNRKLNSTLFCTFGIHGRCDGTVLLRFEDALDGHSNLCRCHCHYEPQPVLRMRRFLADENGHIEADLEGAPEVLATLYAHLSLLLRKAENYVETSLTIKPAGEVEPYVITVQRGSRPSPHELRERAEAEVERLREGIRQAGHGYHCPIQPCRCVMALLDDTRIPDMGAASSKQEAETDG